MDALLSRAPGLYNGGRGFAVEGATQLGARELIALARSVSAVNLFFVRDDELRLLRETVGRAKLGFFAWQMLESDETTRSWVQAMVQARTLPAGLRISVLDQRTPAEVVKEFQELNASQGVAPMPGYMLRGWRYPTVTRMIRDGAGEVVATGYVSDRHDVASRLSGYFFSGVTSVRRDYQGKGLAATLHARLIHDAYTRLHAEHIYTCVHEDNIPSQRLYRGLGLQPRGNHFVVISDPHAFPERFTR